MSFGLVGGGNRRTRKGKPPASDRKTLKLPSQVIFTPEYSLLSKLQSEHHYTNRTSFHVFKSILQEQLLIITLDVRIFRFTWLHVIILQFAKQDTLRIEV